MDLLARTLTAHALVTDEGGAVLDIVQRYTRAWRLLLEYDENRLAASPQTPVSPSASLPLAEARKAIGQLHGELSAQGEASALFGQEHGDQLAAVLGNVEQTFDGKPLYPTAQERAAHLLYFLIKDHPFTDGNKRIGTLLFLEYLQRNGLLWRPDGTPRLADNAMVALALLVAESEPAHKEVNPAHPEPAGRWQPMSERGVSESVVEQAALAWLESIGYMVKHGPDIAPDMPGAERADYGQVVLAQPLRDALARLNPDLPLEALEDAFRRLTRPEGATLEARNRTFHRMVVDGVTVEY